MKFRPAIWLGIIALTAICIVGMFLDFQEVAIAGVVGIASLLPKVLESEEAGR
uniref:Uncharacterized protein n=1 Tax=viral metagenome TaxID=1070528 RepID=A0A6H1ZF44_9ZZZZ